jgi:hypothetical protein
VICKAYGSSIVAGYSEIEVTLKDRLEQLDKPMVTGTFSGAGGIEGVNVVGKRKQWVAGDPGFIVPVLVDASKQLYYVQDGDPGWAFDYRFSVPSDESITAPFDTYVGGVRQTRGANYASEAALLSTAPGSGEVRLWFGPTGTGPVYFRLGGTPEFGVRVFPTGYTQTGAQWHLAAMAERAGVSVPVHYGGSVAVHSRLVDDDSTYLSVMDDAALVDHAAYGFTRLDEFFTVKLLEPDAVDTSVYRVTSTGGAYVTRPLFTFDEHNARNFARVPVAGMEVPIWQVTVKAGDVWPTECDPAALPALRDYMTREDAWASFAGINPAIKDAHKAARTERVSTHQRYFQNSLDMSLWINRYLELFGGLRWVMTLEVDMTDDTLAIELMDNALVDIPRLTCSGGRAFRVTSKTIDIDRRVIVFGLWGGTEGPGGYLGTEGGGGTPPTVDPTATRGLVDPFTLRAYASTGVNAAAFLTIPDFTLRSLNTVSTLPYGAVKLLLNFNGSDDSTTITDESIYALSATGNAEIRCHSSQTKFGAASLKITHRDAGPVTFTGSEFGCGANEPMFVDFWFYHVTSPNFVQAPLIFRWAFSSGFSFDVANYANSAKFQLGTSGFGDETTATAYSTGGWHHVRVQVRANNTIWMRVDGVSMFTGVGASSSSSASGTIYVGSYDGSGTDTTEVYIDNFRACRGYEFPDADFTPPTGPSNTFEA